MLLLPNSPIIPSFTISAESQALGMESRTIKDNQITASSEFENYSPKEARLNNDKYWAPSDSNDPWIRVDLLTTTVVNGIIIQGSSTNRGEGQNTKSCIQTKFRWWFVWHRREWFAKGKPGKLFLALLEKYCELPVWKFCKLLVLKMLKCLSGKFINFPSRNVASCLLTFKKKKKKKVADCLAWKRRSCFSDFLSLLLRPG